jgi:hypothetical protein
MAGYPSQGTLQANAHPIFADKPWSDVRPLRRSEADAYGAVLFGGTTYGDLFTGRPMTSSPGSQPIALAASRCTRSRPSRRTCSSRISMRTIM